MALVLLPCDLPSWPAVQRQLNQIGNVQNSAQLADEMHKLHSMCCISLDPDESDKSDPKLFLGLKHFLDNDISEDEQSTFFRETLPSIVTYALRLKVYKPINGLHYSLQQQSDCSKLDRRFVAALVANCFFSTFPVRTNKTHPTLQDCNFACFFGHLNSPNQRRKFSSLLHYFQHLGNEEPFGSIVLTRQVMSKTASLSIDDWLECDKPLCPVIIRHDGKIEEAEEESYKVCFSSGRIGGNVLNGGRKQEDAIFSAFPELFMILMSTEILELNEAFIAHGLLPLVGSQFGGQSRESNKNLSEAKQMSQTPKAHVCIIDAHDFSLNPAEQYRPDSILRELNKSFTGFRQTPPTTRLPPIGKSSSSTPPDHQSPINEYGKHQTTSEGYHTDSTFGGGESSSTCSHKTADELSLGVMKSLLGQQGGLTTYVNAMLSSRRTEPPAGSSRNDLEAPEGCDSEDCVASGARSVHRLSQCSNLTDALPPSEGGTASENTSTLMCDLIDLMDTDVDLQAVPALSQDHRCKKTVFAIPFYVKSEDRVPGRAGRPLAHHQREDSEDSVYRDCDEAGQGGQSIQRPLRFNTYKPPSKPSAINFPLACSPPLPIPHIAAMRNRDLPASPLEGASMEASFVSCRTHLSSGSSKSSSSSYGLPLEDAEMGFESCMEEDDNNVTNSAKPTTTKSSSEDKVRGETVLSRHSSGSGHHSGQRSQQSRTEESRSYGTVEGGMVADRYTKEDDEDADEENRPPGLVLRRSASTGFILDEDDDIFVGDGLEHEREWLANFRHRSTNPSCSISRRNSSRYSFSSDFSSDLEDILEHFEEKMTEGPVREDPAYSGRLGHGRLLKRTLSDSLTSFSRMPLGACPRSLSLTEKMQQERFGLEYAKRKMVKDTDNPNQLPHHHHHHNQQLQPLPLTSRVPCWPDNPMTEESVDNYTMTSGAGGMSMDCSNLGSCLNSPQSKTKAFQLPGPLLFKTADDDDATAYRCPEESRQDGQENSHPSNFPDSDNASASLCRHLPATNTNDCIPSFVVTEENQILPPDNLSEPQNHLLLTGHDHLPSPQISDCSQLSSPDSMESFRRIMQGYQKLDAQLGGAPKEGFNERDTSADEVTGEQEVAISRSKSDSNVKEMMAKTRSEQARVAREGNANSPGGLQEYCLQLDNRVCRSVSAKNIEELIKQGIWITKEPVSVHGVAEQSLSPLLDSKLRKWQPSVHLDNLECPEHIMAKRDDGSVMKELLSRCEDSSVPNLGGGFGDTKSECWTNVGGPGRKLGRLWFSEDRAMWRQADHLLEDNSSGRSKVHAGVSSELSENRGLGWAGKSCLQIGGFVADDNGKGGVGCSCPAIFEDASGCEVDVCSTASPCLLRSLQSAPSTNTDNQLCRDKHSHHRSSEKLPEPTADSEGVKPIATGNWGCGRKCGDPQLKAMIQWMAASRANAPFMMYYTGGNDRIVKLNIVCRVLLDRHWSVSHVAKAMLQHYAKKVQSDSEIEEMDFLDFLLPKETPEP